MSDKEFERKVNEQFAKNLRYFLDKYQYTQADFAKKMNVSTATISNWCKGLKSPRMDKIDRMCTIFNCYRSDLIEDRGYLIGKKKADGIVIPVLGRVAAGIPINAITEIIDTEEIPEDLAKTGDFFALQIQGDSMEPRIYNGDVVIVRQQEDADSGDIVIAMVNGYDATCKRLIKYATSIALVSLNSKYEPMMITMEEVDTKQERIIGKVVELIGKI